MPTEKKMLILDLDQTLINSELLQDLPMYKNDIFKFDVFNMDNYYLVFSRPHLQEFLEYIFDNFRVSVWTAASKGYALSIIENILIMGNPNRKLEYIFYSYHCKQSLSFSKCSKDLKLLWDIYKLNGFTPQNTFILDDNNNVWKYQKSNCIKAPPFRNNHNDKYLLELMNILKT